MRWGGNMSWWSRRTACGHTLLVIHLAHQNMLFGTNLQNPSRTVTHSPLFSVFSPAVQITHAAGLKNIPSAVKKPSTIRCCFPCRTCDNGWKSTDALWDRDLLRTHLSGDVIITCLRMLCRREAKCEGRKGIVEVNWTGQVGTWGIPRTSYWDVAVLWLIIQKSPMQLPLNWTDGNKQPSPK